MLHDDLTYLARAIVLGEEPSPQVDMAYPNYPVATAIEVYRNNYRGNMYDALAGAYPVIKQLVGDDFFRLLARKFIEQYLSHSANLHLYGSELADFVATFVPARELVYLSDMAALEWACHVAYFAADEAPLDLDMLAQISSELYPDLILHTHVACQVVRSRYPITAIWQAHQTGADSDFHINLDCGPSIALVSREKDVLVRELAEVEADWLSRIQAGIPLGFATAATLERYPDFVLQAALLKLAAQNILTGFYVGATP